MTKTITTIDTDTFLFKITISTERGHFLITANGKNRCGCLHEEILDYRPYLKCFVDLHLSDLDGVPMHALENGYWWLAKAAYIEHSNQPDQSPETCLEYFCNHCRIDTDEASQIILDVQESKHPKAKWAEIMEGMRPRWKTEAENALALLETLV